MGGLFSSEGIQSVDWDLTAKRPQQTQCEKLFECGQPLLRPLLSCLVSLLLDEPCHIVSSSKAGDAEFDQAWFPKCYPSGLQVTFSERHVSGRFPSCAGLEERQRRWRMQILRCRW